MVLVTKIEQYPEITDITLQNYSSSSDPLERLAALISYMLIEQLLYVACVKTIIISDVIL